MSAFLGEVSAGGRMQRPVMTAVLETHDLQAGYGDVTVVRDLNLRVEAGEVVSLLGRNGAGKTTALLTMAGALSPLGGEISFLGETGKASLSSRARKGLGLMTDDRSVFFGLTGRENLRVARGDAERAAAVSGARAAA